MKNLIRTINNLIRTIGAIINTPAVPLPPRCSSINSLLLHLCDFDHDLHKWVLRWLAYPLRHPGVQMSTCLVFNGGDGWSKRAFFGCVAPGLYGPTTREIKADQLRNVFNTWAVDARLVILEGRYSRVLLRQMKSLMTSSYLWINEQGKPARMAQNQMNFVLVSGSSDFLPIDAGDRRCVVVEVPPLPHPAFLRAVHDEIKNGGVDAFRHYLLHELDMGGFNEYTQAPAHTAASRIAEPRRQVA